MKKMNGAIKQPQLLKINMFKLIDSGIDRDILDIDNTRLTAADKMMLNKIETTVDIDLTDNILAHQKLLNDSKTADLDVEITKNSDNSKDNDEFDLDMDQ